jgi:tRNA pseudouridine55 synthase
MTSHDVVAQVRRLTQRAGLTRKVGHAGTLDPMATGVLIVCLGHATRLSEYVMHTTKTYTARVVLGVETDSYDADGSVTAVQDASHVTREQIEGALRAFVGTIDQLPPIYSAIKKDGKRLYELARAGIETEISARRVTILAIDVLEWAYPHLTIRVRCESGTYIRSLAHDLGAALGTGAHLDRLERNASGAFALESAVTLETLGSLSDWNEVLVQPAEALREYGSYVVSDVEAAEIMQGRMIASQAPAAEAFAFAYLPDGWLLAVMESREMMWKPHKVFLPEH